MRGIIPCASCFASTPVRQRLEGVGWWIRRRRRMLRPYDVADGLGKGAVRMGGYGPYIAGVVLGLLVAFALSAVLGITGMAQLLLFGVLPALGGTVAERLVAGRR